MTDLGRRMQARRAGACSAGCGLGIRQGEEIVYTQAGGARHLECAGAEGKPRVNEKAGACASCGAHVPAGGGALVRGEKGWEVRGHSCCGGR